MTSFVASRRAERPSSEPLNVNLVSQADKLIALDTADNSSASKGFGITQDGTLIVIKKQVRSGQGSDIYLAALFKLQ